MKAAAHPRERRVHQRFPHSGSVQLRFDDPTPVLIEAKLLDVSAGGFRATHEIGDLASGLEVWFQREGAAGLARVIWTHVRQGRQTSGFLVLQQPASR